MPLLKLSSIGKIYVSDKNVTVGIRDVSLSFDRGEFVAVTGKSGSGKSTLLNVISGIDSYEEGELFIEGQPTSHYLQPEWEEYREKYISFIFQDYNIIESFTVLENVELALMHIEDKRERRRRALELIERVGLTSHIKQKGSKLSGGQKQRTVIARALAKDSPIILADEPTGNLDSKTSREIIELLFEVSKDKLLIVVTHNFDDFEDYATRHIRIFDGAIESDHVIREAQPQEEMRSEPTYVGKSTAKTLFKNGLTLGYSIFKAKPRLSLFLALLMIVGTLGIFFVTGMTGDASEMFEPSYMFNHIDGRVVLTTQSGRVIPNEELGALAEKYGAKDYLRFDVLLDESYGNMVMIPSPESYDGYEYVQFYCTYNESFGEDIVGRYPEKSNEVFLNIPISYMDEFGEDSLLLDSITMNGMEWTVTGVKYYYDNNIIPKCLFTEDGFKIATAVHYMMSNSTYSINASIKSKDGSVNEYITLDTLVPSFDIEDSKVYIDLRGKDFKIGEDSDFDVRVNFNVVYYKYDNYGYHGKDTIIFEREFTAGDIAGKKPVINTEDYYSDSILIISDELLTEIATTVLDESYRQASLFFADDRAAEAAAEALSKEGYIAVPSNTTYTPSALEAVLKILVSTSSFAVWIAMVVFLSFFINLCSARSLEAFKSDMAIMRSMGIQVKVIRIGMYVRMTFALIPAFVMLVILAVLIYTSPSINEHFTYLYPWQYALISLGMALLTVLTTRKQVARLFGESVKKSLKGGSEQ